MTPTHTLSDFDFALPDELIAQHPAAERSGSRLLDGTGADPVDRLFRELPGLLRAGDLLVVNDTRVLKARLFGVKASGGAVEALVERVLPGFEVLAHLRASKAPRPGSMLRFADSFDAVVLGRGEAGRVAGDEDAAEASVEASPDAGGRLSNKASSKAGSEGSKVGSESSSEADVVASAGTAREARATLFRLGFPEEPHGLLARHGHLPLPPYIRHPDTEEDERRYQTVFAERPGAVAAPTAALHFDAPLLDRVQRHGIGLARVTLHVGAGTFQPVRHENLALHAMHSEWFEVGPAAVEAIARTRAAGGRIVAVGTTTLRALESAARGASGRLEPGSRETDLFIVPGFDFRVVDVLITNFHLPRSTLLMLVSAFAGYERIVALYRHAIEARYRFFSYGDAMLLERAVPTP